LHALSTKFVCISWPYAVKKSLATIVMFMKYIASKESVITDETQKEVLVENTLVLTVGYLK